MANGIRKFVDAALHSIRRLSAGSPFQSYTRFKGELGVKLIKGKK